MEFLLLAAPILLFALTWLLIGRRPRLLPGLGGRATSIAFSPGGQTLVCASSNSFVQKWIPDIQKWRSFDSTANRMSSMPPLFLRLCFSPDGQTLYAGGSALTQSYSATGHAWDMSTRQRRFSFNHLQGPAFDISPDGRWAAMGYRDAVNVIDLQGKPARLPKDSFRSREYFQMLPSRRLRAAGNVTCVAFSPDNRTLVVGGESVGSPVAFWDVPSARRIEGKTWPVATNFPGIANAMVSSAPAFVEWSPDGGRVAMANASQLTIYNWASGSSIEVLWPRAKTFAPTVTNFGVGNVPILAWSPDGQWLFFGGDEVRQWRAQDLKLSRSFGIGGPLAVAPDGKTLATANRSESGDPMGVWLWKIG